MKLEILNEKELTAVTAAGSGLRKFGKGLKSGITSGPKGIISGAKNIYSKKRIMIGGRLEYSPEYESGKITGGGIVTAGACVAACGIAYGAYRLGKLVYNKIAK